MIRKTTGARCCVVAGLFPVLMLVASGCALPEGLTCKGDEPYINGELFSCNACYRALGCREASGGGLECPLGLGSRSCLDDEIGRHFCCNDECISCGEPVVTDDICTGYTGADSECCRTGNPCGLSENDECDCDGTCGWDFLDCRLEGPVVDVLVVMDNTMGMEGPQDALSGSMSTFVDALISPDDASVEAVVDLHLGVITTDMGTGGYDVPGCLDPIKGDDGVLQWTPIECSPSTPVQFVSYASEELDSAQLEVATSGASCTVQLGTSGCGWEQHLKALERAVITNYDANNGFLRPSSHLVIIIFTTEDDCSVSAGNEYIHDTFDGGLGEYNLRCMNHPHLLTSVDDHFDFIDSLRHLPNHMTMLLVAGVPTGETCEGYGNEIGGCLTDPAMIETVNPEHPTALLPSCESPSRGAMPARRLVELAQHFGNAAIVQSICHDDYSVGMGLLLRRTQEMISTD